MEQFVIEGGNRLAGEVKASGNKNAALKLIAACLLTDEPVTLTNMPDISDVRTMCELVRSLGVEADWLGEGRLRIHARTINSTRADPVLVQKIRASIVIAGPM